MHETWWLKSDWWIVIFTGALAAIAIFQLIVFGLQARRLRETVQSSERAAMPFLYPRVADFNLHPPEADIRDGVTHTPTVNVLFENMGRTPAVVRQIRFQLFTYERDLLPDLPPRIAERPIQSDAVISPGSLDGRRECTHRIPLSAPELRELAARAGPNRRFRRIYLIGYVVYDDFFDIRHTKTFCLKIRQHGFQAARGGARYNGIKRERSPLGDALGVPTEDD